MVVVCVCGGLCHNSATRSKVCVYLDSRLTTLGDGREEERVSAMLAAGGLVTLGSSLTRVSSLLLRWATVCPQQTWAEMLGTAVPLSVGVSWVSI